MSDMEQTKIHRLPDAIPSAPESLPPLPIFKTPADWETEDWCDRIVMDSDGWRAGCTLGEKSWHTPITKEEYQARAQESTRVSKRHLTKGSPQYRPPKTASGTSHPYDTAVGTLEPGCLFLGTVDGAQQLFTKLRNRRNLVEIIQLSGDNPGGRYTLNREDRVRRISSELIDKLISEA